MKKPIYIPWTGNIQTRHDTRDIRAAIWALFWLLIVTTGEPDLLSALAGLIGRLG